MTRPSRSLAAAAALALALGVGSWASAERGRHSHHRPSLERAVEALELDADATAKLDAIFDASRSARRELFRSLREQHDAMRALLEDAGSTEAAALSQADAIGQLHSELRKHELRTLFQVRAQLSPEQQQQLAAAMQERGRHGKPGKACGEGSEEPDAR